MTIEDFKKECYGTLLRCREQGNINGCKYYESCMRYEFKIFKEKGLTRFAYIFAEIRKQKLEKLLS